MRSASRFCLFLFLIFAAVPFCVGKIAVGAAPLPGAATEEVAVAVVKNFPPYYIVTEDGKITGFAVSFMNELAKRARLRIEYKVFQSWGDARAALRNGTVDLIPNMGITEGRQGLGSFSPPYESFRVQLYVSNNGTEIGDFSDLKGRKVGTIASNIAERILPQHTGLEPRLYDDPRSLIEALIANEVEYIAYPGHIIDEVANAANLRDKIRQTGPPLKIVLRGMLAREGKGYLLGKLAPHLNAFTASGEFEELYKRWFGHQSLMDVSPWNWAVGTAVSVLVLAFAGLLCWFLRLGRLRANNPSQAQLEQRLIRRLIMTSVGMSVVLFVLAGFIILIFYGIGFEEDRKQLYGSVESTKQLIQSVGRFDRKFSNHPKGARAGTVAQVREGLGNTNPTWELLLGERVGDLVKLIFRRDAAGMETPVWVSMSGEKSVAMRRALAGEAGTVIGQDYRGNEVLAAYTPLPILGLGLVIQKDISDIRAPYIRAAWLSALVALAFSFLVGCGYFLLSLPLVRKVVLSEERIALAMAASNDGFWDWDRTTDQVHYSPRWLAMLGLPEDRVDNSINEWKRLVHPDDLERTLADIEDYLSKRIPEIHQQIRMRHSDGSWMDIFLRGSGVWDQYGQCTRLICTQTDLTELRETEKELIAKSALLETTLESMSHGITVHDSNSRLIAFNQKSVDLRDYPPDFFRLGMHVKETHRYKARLGYYQDENPEEVLKKRQDRNHWKEGFYQERRRQNGRIVAIRREPMPDGGFVTTYTDITALKKMEQQLKASEERFRKAFESTNVGIVMRDFNDRTLVVNDAFCRMVGRTQDELQDMHFKNLNHPDERAETSAFVEKIRSGEIRQFSSTRRLVRKDGELIWVQSELNAMCDDNGRPIRSIALYQDITDLKHAEMEAAQNSELLTMTFETVVQGLAVYDGDLKLLKFNRRFQDLFGFPDDFLKPGRGLDDIIKFRQDHRTYPQSGPGGILSRVESYLTRSQSGERLLADGRTLIFDSRPLAGGGFVISYTDITEQKQSENALRKAETYLRSITENMADGLITIDERGTIESFSHGAEVMFGYAADEVLGKNVTVLMPENYAQAHGGHLSDFVSTGRSKIIDVGAREVVGRRKDGTEFPMELAVSAVEIEGSLRFIGSTRDISERKRIEEQRAIVDAKLQQTQKMEAIGTLAGGIAHDFNNTLTPIIGLSEFILDGLPEGDPNKEYLARILQSSERARKLVRQILDFSRSDSLKLRPMNLRPLLEDSIDLLSSIIPSIIRIKAKLDDGPIIVRANETQIHQVVMNLATNAAAAIGAKGGVIKIVLRAAELDSSFTHLHPGLTAGNWASITVEDTGCGMDEDLIKRIFEPFFTTKGVSEGTGLGLATVHGIVTAHGGTVLVSSEVGVGTKFQVYLPILMQAEVARTNETMAAAN